ncbi:probable pathogenesis-related protein CaO19.6200 isoform X4 [Mycetomoellerius zeteki]|nr:PREDICTED: probable pathogenesis-related protein CaO19.6200 isoform X4 [Trachymyrmex zeteki]XP_018309482.1 PREDICTED: probable pathogenesis-related protein CaO19.6200 isoform X4 [Trachymyrmex zeteki]
MIPPTMHGHEFNQPLSRVVMVRKTDQRTFSKGRRGGEPLLETVTRETVELFNGGRAERKYTSETRDIVTPKSSSILESYNQSSSSGRDVTKETNNLSFAATMAVDALQKLVGRRKSRTDSVRSKSPLTASPASPGPLSNSLHGSFHGSLGSDGMSCSSARSSSASPDSARYSSSQITKIDTRKPSVRRSGPPKEFINVCLDTHNFYRSRHGVPPLRLSKQLCKTSQDWANILAAKGRLEHRANIDYGENLYCMWSSNPKTVIGGEEPVNEWYAEEAQHQYGKEPTTLKTGHFTQVIWRDSTELGVGMARNRNGEVYVVCNYNPAGNFLGSFTENVLPPVDASPTKRINFTDLKQHYIDEQTWQQEALLVHNEYRRKHRVPDLRLSPELTAAAKAWANTLLNTNKLVPQSSSPYGENIYSMQCSDPKLIVSAREVISKWYSERKEHKFSIEPKVLNTCHFTQIVWKNTTEMGIAMAKRDGSCVVVACYHPRGNIVGQFTENVLKPIKSVY